MTSGSQTSCRFLVRDLESVYLEATLCSIDLDKVIMWCLSNSVVFCCLYISPKASHLFLQFPLPSPIPRTNFPKTNQPTYFLYFIFVNELTPVYYFILGYKNSKTNRNFYEIETSVKWKLAHPLTELIGFSQSVLFPHGDRWESRWMIRLGFENKREQRQRGIKKKRSMGRQT